MTVGFDCYVDQPVSRASVIGKDWQINVAPPQPVNASDIPRGWSHVVSRRRHLIRITIDGKPDARTDKALNALLRKLCERYKAVVVDLQTLEAWTANRRVKLPDPAQD